MVYISLFNLTYEKVTQVEELIKDLVDIIKKNRDLFTPIKNIIKDISRYIIMLNAPNMRDILIKTEEFAYETIKNPQKFSIFRRRRDDENRLEEIISELYNKIWDLYKTLYGIKEDEDGDENKDKKEEEQPVDPRLFYEQRYIFEFILANTFYFINVM